MEDRDSGIRFFEGLMNGLGIIFLMVLCYILYCVY